MPAGSFDVIVADNNSACGLDAVRAVAGHSAQVVLAKEQGAGPARNAGAGASRGEILAFIDSDCVPASDWLAARSCGPRNRRLRRRAGQGPCREPGTAEPDRGLRDCFRL